jgi:hypothetical protein
MNDNRYTSVGSQCNISIEICPNEWDQFEPTEDVKTRFCNHCENKVYLCSTEEEAVAHAKERHCIAIMPQPKRDKKYDESWKKKYAVLGRSEFQQAFFNNLDD